MSGKSENQNNKKITPEELDQLIISEYPYPIAVNYWRMLETKDWEKKTRRAIEIFGYSVRAIALALLSQYLIPHLHQVNDEELNQRLHRKLSRAALGDWVEFLFLCLRAYRGKRNLFFMPELYDLYWDTSLVPHRPRTGIRSPFYRLVEIRNDLCLAHGITPEHELAWEKLGQEVLDKLRQILLHFSFLKNYDLIHITGTEGGETTYERFTGQEIIPARGLLAGEGNKPPKTGWFYLSHQDRSLLRLHPLLIYWTNPGEI